MSSCTVEAREESEQAKLGASWEASSSLNLFDLSQMTLDRIKILKLKLTANKKEL